MRLQSLAKVSFFGKTFQVMSVVIEQHPKHRQNGYGDSVEGIQLKTLEWSLQPLAATLPRTAFCFDPARFVEGSIEFDCGLLMRRIRTACSFKL
jgi:hypothetical protein